MPERPIRTTLMEITVPEQRETEPVAMHGGTITMAEALELDLGGDTQISPNRASLVVVAGPTMGQVYLLDKESTLGRGPLSDIVIDDPAVSRRHLRLLERQWEYALEDLGSVNGTYVNGQQVRRTELTGGERIQLGPRVILRFDYLDPAEEAMHRQLFESSTRDPLTSTFNKRYLIERLTAEVAHASRHLTPLEVIVFDIDHFKKVNDQYGHLIGDNVLRVVAQTVQATIRSEDVLGRFGGEEFVVLSRGADAARLAERIRSAIEHADVASERGLLHITASFGVASLAELGSDHATPRALLDKADLRLLQAKQRGRNQVCSNG